MESSMRRRRVRWAAAALVAGVLAGVLLYLPIDAGVTRVVNEADIARPPEDVYAYVTTPVNWPLFHPSSLVVSGDAGHSLVVGESVVEDFRVAGRRGRATWRVTAREPDRLWRIAGQIDGQDSGTVTYSLAPTPGGGTHFVREFDYTARSLLFALVNIITLRRQVEQESAQAVRQLKANLERAN
jgi:uncharacterized protein YndB with AHSA1/START domain